MLKNYLKIAFRNLAKRKLFTSINILGLSIAIACSLLLFLTAFKELSYDRFHENGSKIYRTFLETQSPEGTKITTVMCVPFLPALKEKVPGIEYGTRWSGTGTSMAYGEKTISAGIRFADTDFFKMFSFPLLKGDPNTALSDPGNIILHEKRAKELFGEEDPMGKSIRLNYEGLNKDFIVSGILKKLPPQSSFEIGSVVSFENSPDYTALQNNWGDRNHSVYIQVAPQVKLEDLKARFPAFVQEVFSDDIEQLTESGWKSDDKGNLMRLGLQSFFDLRFGTALKADSNQNTRGYIFPIALIIMGFFILTIACINFINLNIGSSVNRYVEVGIRKVLGASKGQLTLQFWGESFAVVFLSTIIAMMGVQWSLPYYNSFFRYPVSMNNPFILLAIALILLFVVILGGTYPALIISKFQPASVLKKQTQLQKPGKLRNLLVVIQFAISIILISATIVVYQQLNYLQEKPLGFNKEQVISLPVGDHIRGERALALLKQKLKDQPDILNITGSYNNYGMGLDGSAITSVMGFMQQGKQMYSHWMGTHYDYLETMEIELLAGRGFDPQIAQDSINAVVINERLAQQLDKTPEELIGTTLEVDPDYTIIGVV
ncbi:MAG: ABC transporter permease, partial [Bacteroidota bacterium]